MHCRLRVSLLRSDAELRRRSLPARYTRCTLRIFAQPPHRTRSPLSVAQKVLNFAGKGGYGSPSVFFDVVERIRAYQAFVASFFSVKRELGDLAIGLWKNFRILCFCHSILGSMRVRGSRIDLWKDSCVLCFDRFAFWFKVGWMIWNWSLGIFENICLDVIWKN